MCLVSIEQCQSYAALKPRHLQGLSANSIQTLVGLGCLCILDPRAACASPILRHQESITTALTAVSVTNQIPLQQLTAPDCLSADDFQGLVQILVNLAATPSQETAVWAVLQQCSVFSTASGAIQDLSSQDQVLILPHQQWEQHLPLLTELLFVAITIVPYWGSLKQRRLLRYSQLQPMPLTPFLTDYILPALNRSNTSTMLPFVGQALADLAGLPDLPLKNALTQLYLGGQQQTISSLLDCNSITFRLLFGPFASGMCSLAPHCLPGPAPQPLSALPNKLHASTGVVLQLSKQCCLLYQCIS